MPATLLSPALLPILLLVGSNIFMTLAWYGHLRFKETPLIGVIMASWGIALVEYSMAVPANRIGSAVYTTAQLKTIQEIITLLVFAGFSILCILCLKEPIHLELRHRLCTGCGRRLLYLSRSAVSRSLTPYAVNLFIGCNNLMKARRLVFDISALNGVEGCGESGGQSTHGS